MKIYNVISIYDNDEFVTIVTKSGSSIHLPMNAQHSICIDDMPNPSDHHVINVTIDLYQ